MNKTQKINNIRALIEDLDGFISIQLGIVSSGKETLRELNKSRMILFDVLEILEKEK